MSAQYTKKQIVNLANTMAVNRRSLWMTQQVGFSVTNKQTGTTSEEVLVPFDSASNDLFVSLVVGNMVDEVITLDGVFKKMEDAQ